MQTLENITSERVLFRSPDISEEAHTRLIDAFVDDTSLSFTEDDISKPYDQILQRLQDVAQKWERVLFFSGGASQSLRSAHGALYIGRGQKAYPHWSMNLLLAQPSN
jgi:hypothetical protein